MKLPQDKFCVLPWISLEASPIGTVRPCCLADDEILDDAGNKFELSTANFADIQNSDHMRQLRQQFLDSEQPQTCRKCWSEERAGRTSKRMHTLDRLKHMGISDTWTADAKPLMFLDLKLGNICNLKCRICGSWSSSQFATEELNQLPRDEQKKSHAYTMLRAGAWPRDNPQFWDQIDSVVDDIRYIEFTGGEPFMIAEHFVMLQGIVDRGIAGQVEIHYNTNGTQYPEAAESIWQHFKTVEIAFSIDDTGERFEYQRSNAVWADVCANLDRFRDLKEIYSNIQLQVCTTVNVFNVRYLGDVAAWLEKNRDSFDFVYWNMMHDAWYFSIACLPDTAKKAISEYLNSVETIYRDEFDRIRDFMNSGASTDGFMTRMKIADLDRKRDQDLSAVAPELADLLQYEKHEL
ncbi:twitch domain-containing radical SAM protein [Haliscomenobacter sp.]|uniref:twitch domain-containing radical SAM protein n=1 Tax=Haliscomenobacter sp. TaxID=2717303 RepID=UPI003364C2E5